MGLIAALREFADAYRLCDDRDWLLCPTCAWTRRLDGCDYPRCPICQDELEVRVNRTAMLELARFDLREALLPIRWHEFGDGETTVETLRFRRLVLHRRLVPNPFPRP